MPNGSWVFPSCLCRTNPSFLLRRSTDIQKEECRRNWEGWYCSFEDCYGDALREMNGEQPLDKGSPEEQLDEAKNLSWSNIRLSVSKIIQLAKKGMPGGDDLP